MLSCRGIYRFGALGCAVALTVLAQPPAAAKNCTCGAYEAAIGQTNGAHCTKVCGDCNVTFNSGLTDTCTLPAGGDPTATCTAEYSFGAWTVPQCNPSPCHTGVNFKVSGTESGNSALCNAQAANGTQHCCGAATGG